MELSTDLRGGMLTATSEQEKLNFPKKILENGWCSVVKQHRIKYQELICPRAYRNCNNLL